MLQPVLLKTGYHININDPAWAPGCRMMPALLILHDRLANDPAAVAGGVKDIYQVVYARSFNAYFI